MYVRVCDNIWAIDSERLIRLPCAAYITADASEEAAQSLQRLQPAVSAFCRVNLHDQWDHTHAPHVCYESDSETPPVNMDFIVILNKTATYVIVKIAMCIF